MLGCLIPGVNQSGLAFLMQTDVCTQKVWQSKAQEQNVKEF